jgi:hypothetical protein
MARLVVSGVADWLLAFAVGPARAVGDHLPVMVRNQMANDSAQRVELVCGGIHEAGRDVVAEPEIAAPSVGLALALGLPALLVLGGRVAHLLI